MNTIDEIINRVQEGDADFFKNNRISSEDINAAIIYDNDWVPVISYALRNGQIEIAELLVEQCLSLEHKENNYLIDATRNSACSLKMLKKLIDLGCDVNEKNCGYTPMFNLAYHGDLEKINYFIKNGADLTVVNNYGVNIVSNALYSPAFKLDTLILLLENGADYLTIDNDGESFVDNAKIAKLPSELLNVFEKALNKKITRDEFIVELKRAKNIYRIIPSYESEKLQLSLRWQAVQVSNISAGPKQTDSEQLSRACALAIKNETNEAIRAGIFMMDNMSISALLLFLMASCFKEVHEMELFAAYKDMFIFACENLSPMTKFAILILQDRMGEDNFYRPENMVILAKNFF